jgi:hypothetical protein
LYLIFEIQGRLPAQQIRGAVTFLSVSAHSGALHHKRRSETKVAVFNGRGASSGTNLNHENDSHQNGLGATYPCSPKSCRDVVIIGTRSLG